MGKHILLSSEIVREQIEEYIAVHGLSSGDCLPSERMLAQALGTSRVTLRDALVRMRDEGRLITKHGCGSFIAPKKYWEDVHELISFSGGWNKDGLAVSSQVLHFKIIEANKKASHYLGLRLGEPIYSLRRLRLVNGVPLAIETALLPSQLLCGLDQFSFDTASLYHVLEQFYNIQPVRQRQTIAGTKLDSGESALLQVEENAFAFYMSGVTFDVDDHPIEYCTALYPAERYGMYGTLGPQPTI